MERIAIENESPNYSELVRLKTVWTAKVKEIKLKRFTGIEAGNYMKFIIKSDIDVLSYVEYPTQTGQFLNTGDEITIPEPCYFGLKNNGNKIRNANNGSGPGLGSGTKVDTTISKLVKIKSQFDPDKGLVYFLFYEIQSVYHTSIIGSIPPDRHLFAPKDTIIIELNSKDDKLGKGEMKNPYRFEYYEDHQEPPIII